MRSRTKVACGTGAAPDQPRDSAHQSGSGCCIDTARRHPPFSARRASRSRPSAQPPTLCVPPPVTPRPLPRRSRSPVTSQRSRFRALASRDACECPSTPRGVTLLELLVVLALMSLAAVLAMPAMQRLLPGSEVGARAPETQILVDARRHAVRRGEPLRLRVEPDGAWALVAVHGGAIVDGGRVPDRLAWFPDLRIDAMGGCALSSSVAPPEGVESWDPLQCEWRPRAGGPG